MTNFIKNKTGSIIGFIVGMAGFLFLFKVIFLRRITPEDELAPGMVLIAAVMSGLAFAFAGQKTQRYIEKKRRQVH